LLDRFNEINMKFAEPMSDDEMNDLIAEQAELQEKIDHAGAWELDRKLEIAADALRLPPWEATVKNLSGGERRRVALCKLLVSNPDMLILDEPTNHIDLQGKEELEIDLQQPGISLLFTSHDQRFIETIATRFWWIDAGRLLEIHDPSRYFDSLKEASPGSIGGSGGDDRLPGNTDNSTLADEDALLERVCELERLLAADKARKPKFQKLQRRQQWQVELDTLMKRMK